MGKIYFYHSFPRHKSQKLAFDVLQSILKLGLILTAERRVVPKSGFLNAISLVQDRLCFTAIEPKYLAVHARDFGMFSFEFEEDVMRSFGAQPVMYLAGSPPKPRLLARAGVDLTRHVFESREVLRRLLKLADKKTPFGRKALQVRKNIYPYAEPFQRCFYSVQALLNLYYPTDRKKTKSLKFFRQREWRITPNFSYRNKWLYPLLTEPEKKILMKINAHAFAQRVGRKKHINRCRRFPMVGKINVLESARRLIVPDRFVPRVRRILRKARSNIRVVGKSTLPSARIP